jgi:hypothetical protein
VFCGERRWLRHAGLLDCWAAGLLGWAGAGQSGQAAGVVVVVVKREETRN